MHNIKLIVLLLFISTKSMAALIIEPTVESQMIGKQASYLLDEERKYNINDIWTLKQENKFVSIEQDFFARPNSEHNYWFSFSVKTGLENIWINVNNNNLDSVHFFILNDSGEVIKEVLTGSILPKSTREFDAHTYWLEITNHKDTAIKHIFIKVYSSMAMEIPIEIGSLKSLLKTKSIHDFYAHFFIGALVVMLLYNLFIFFIVRDRIYLYYLSYIFGTIFATTSVNNYPLVENIIGVNLAHTSVTSWIWVSFVSMLLFTIDYLELKTKKKKVYYLLLVYIVILLLFGIVELIFPDLKISNAYQTFVPLSFISCLFVAYNMAYHKDKKALLYSLGWTIAVLSSVIYLLVINGFLPYNTFTRNITYIGIVTEVIIFSIALAQRITSLKKQQEILNFKLTKKNNELILNNESLDSFNYHVSHDLKTVLNNATVLSKMIKKYNDKQDYAKSNEVIEKLQQVTANGSETVQSFLSLGKVDSLISSDNKVTINIDNQISELLTNHNLNDKVKVSIYNPDNITLTMHEKAFESIFLNLITNAIKYCNTFPNVEIDVLKSKGKVFILIKDNGIGIDLTNNKTKVFEPFVRILNEKNVEGTGVGLFLVRKIINSLNGSIQIESELGKGTIFTITLPSND